MAFYRPTWAEVDLDKFQMNIDQLQNHIGANRSILAVVKANAYGHGAIPMASAAIQAGAAYLGVSSIDEAIDLREGGIEAPILILGYSSPEYADEIVAYDLTQTVFSDDLVSALAAAAAKREKRAKIHVKLDTGMGRIGFRDPMQAVQFIQRAMKFPSIYVEGAFSHLATAESTDFTYANEQYQKWQTFRKLLAEHHLEIPYQHISNSGAGLQHLEMESSFVRFGLSLYGLYPAPHLATQTVRLEPVLKLVSRIVHLQRHPEGSKISYGSTYSTQEGALIATIPIGYADGYSRKLSNCGFVLVRGQRVPIVGSICMDQMMIDVSSVEGVSIGDEVVLYGQQGTENISVDEVADKIGSISWEVLCALGRRVPRLYLKSGKVQEIRKW